VPANVQHQRLLIAVRRILLLAGTTMWLRLAYWVAQVGYADASNDRRIAQSSWYVSEVVKESHSRAEKECCDIDIDFVEQASGDGYLGTREIKQECRST